MDTDARRSRVESRRTKVPSPRPSPIRWERVAGGRVRVAFYSWLRPCRVGSIRVHPWLKPLGGGFFFGFQEPLQVPDAGGMTQLSQRLGFDLPNAFAGDVVHLADFLQRALVAVHQPEAHFENLSFALGQCGQDVPELFLQETVAGHIGGVLGALVLDEITDADICLLYTSDAADEEDSV